MSRVDALTCMRLGLVLSPKHFQLSFLRPIFEQLHELFSPLTSMISCQLFLKRPIYLVARDGKYNSDLLLRYRIVFRNTHYIRSIHLSMLISLKKYTKFWKGMNMFTISWLCTGEVWTCGRKLSRLTPRIKKLGKPRYPLDDKPLVAEEWPLNR